jgi:hypothetical protein
MRLSAGSFTAPAAAPLPKPVEGPVPPADTAGPCMKPPPCACAAARVRLETWARADMRDAWRQGRGEGVRKPVSGFITYCAHGQQVRCAGSLG